MSGHCRKLSSHHTVIAPCHHIILSLIISRKHQVGTQHSRRHPGGKPGDTQEALRRHRGDTERDPRGTRDPGGNHRHSKSTQETRTVLEATLNESGVLYQGRRLDRPFDVGGAKATLAKSAACADKKAAAFLEPIRLSCVVLAMGHRKSCHRKSCMVYGRQYIIHILTYTM